MDCPLLIQTDSVGGGPGFKIPISHWSTVQGGTVKCLCDLPRRQNRALRRSSRAYIAHSSLPERRFRDRDLVACVGGATCRKFCRNAFCTGRRSRRCPRVSGGAEEVNHIFDNKLAMYWELYPQCIGGVSVVCRIVCRLYVRTKFTQVP